MNYEYPDQNQYHSFSIIKINNDSYNQNPTPGPGSYESNDSFVQIN